MKEAFLIVIFFILCAQALSSSYFESPFTSKAGCFNLSKQIEGKQLQDLNEIIKMKESGRYEELKNVRRNQKGKGVYGGDIGRRPRNNAHSGASSLLVQLSSPISFAMVPVSMGTLLVFLYLF